MNNLRRLQARGGKRKNGFVSAGIKGERGFGGGSRDFGCFGRSGLGPGGGRVWGRMRIAEDSRGNWEGQDSLGMDAEVKAGSFGVHPQLWVL